jgi:hypothetical protein
MLPAVVACDHDLAAGAGPASRVSNGVEEDTV